MNRTRVSLPGPSLDEKEKAMRIEVFWEELEHYPIEQVEDAFREIRRKSKFFPSPGDVIEIIQRERETLYLESKTHEAIDWMKATPEGKAIASDIARKLIGKIISDLEDKEREKAKSEDVEFEVKRERLRKQSKFFLDTEGR